MTIEYQLTIGDACKKHGVNRSTLNLWVKNGKVVSEKRMEGRKPIYFINEQSLLEQMERSKATTRKPNGELEQPPKPEDLPKQEPKTEPPSVPDRNEPEEPEPDSEKKSKPRKRPRSNVAVTRAKNSMRSLDREELIRVNSWLAKRILCKSKPPW
ncbi:MAG: hypothetical protein WD342_07115 [Verrucomicrobiales bacterium]